MVLARRQLREASSESSRRFLAAYTASRNRLGQLTAQGIRNVERAIRELRDEIGARLLAFTGAADEPFRIALVPRLRAEIDEALESFRIGASGEIQARLTDAFDLGGRVTATAFQRAGLPVLFPSISPELLSVLRASVENVLAEIVSDLGDRIGQQLRFAAVGLEPSSAAISRVANLLRTSTEVRRGLRRRVGFGFQAESIVRTEVGRMFSSAQQAASEQIAGTIPDLRKRWVTTLRQRRGHVDVERRYATGGEIGPIPVSQRFKVTDFTRTGRTSFLTLGGRIQPQFGTVVGQRVVRTKPFTRRGRIIVDRMLHPRDPAGSAGNVISCTCLVIEVIPEIESAVSRALGIVQTGG